MAKCKGCGVELLDGTVFCPYCGSQVQVEKEQVEKVEVIDSNGTSYVNEDPSTGTYQFKEKAVFKVFAILGMVFGIVNLSLTFLSFVSSSIPGLAYILSILGVELAVPGFVFSIIGKKSIKNHGKAVFGFVVNLVCMILLFIMAVVFLIKMAEAGEDPYLGGYYY